eukprot:gb/GFBE01062093.1/.p1 GENE.gb/GFBE01062093.1/~~gb/GFBE01062093.1/.p1  ORF type:complete len:316 (+),score=70.83 gb/GFBE01062093.1/:1-948(+)
MQLRATALLAAAVLASPGAAHGIDYEAGEELSGVQLLQTAVMPERKREAKRAFRCAPVEKVWDETGRYEKEGYCGPSAIPTVYDKKKWHPGSPAEADLFRPLSEVRMDHMADDLFDHFGFLNDWINPFFSASDLVVVGPDGVNKSVGYEAIKKKYLFSQGDKFPNPVEMTFKWDGHEIHTLQDHSCMNSDDPYCYANGWLKNQNDELNASVFDDHDKFNIYAEKQCKMMHDRYDFGRENITMLTHLQETNPLYVMADNSCDKSEMKGPLPKDRDYAKHAYVKCLMNLAMTEIPYCYFRGCVLEGNRIGHADECDY